MAGLHQAGGRAAQRLQRCQVGVVEPFDGLVRDFVVDRGGKVMVRGVRGVTDFDFEFGLAGMNRNLAPDVETIFMTPAATLQAVSSTLIREISQLGGDVAPYVAPLVLERLLDKRRARLAD